MASQSPPKPTWLQRLKVDVSCWWRESLFLVLLFSSAAALGEEVTSRQIVGVAEAAAFIAIATSGLGRLNTLGLDQVRWCPVRKEVAAACSLAGCAAALAVTMVARVSGQAIGSMGSWSQFVLATSVGPALEEVVFRGYLLTWLLWSAARMRIPFPTLSVIVVSAGLFSTAHASRAGTTCLQHLCIFGTGTLYAGLRLRFGSSVASTLAHSAYNLMLFYWSSVLD